MFEERVSKIFEKFGNHKIFALATSFGDDVTVRMMSTIVHDRKFYFQTDIKFTKYHQLQNNQKVALCFDRYQIKGVCKEIGLPLEEKNEFFAKLYKEYSKWSYDNFSKISTERLFEITPTEIYTWEYEGETPYRTIYDFQNKKVIEEANH